LVLFLWLYRRSVILSSFIGRIAIWDGECLLFIFFSVLSRFLIIGVLKRYIIFLTKEKTNGPFKFPVTSTSTFLYEIKFEHYVLSSRHLKRYVGKLASEGVRSVRDARGTTRKDRTTALVRNTRGRSIRIV